MKLKFFTLVLIVCSILFGDVLKMPLSHKSFNHSRPIEYERGIFLIILARQSLETWMGPNSTGGDFLEFKRMRDKKRTIEIKQEQKQELSDQNEQFNELLLYVFTGFFLLMIYDNIYKLGKDSY